MSDEVYAIVDQESGETRIITVDIGPYGPVLQVEGFEEELFLDCYNGKVMARFGPIDKNPTWSQEFTPSPVPWHGVTYPNGMTREEFSAAVANATERMTD